jgi:hypothetical protein
MTTETSTTTTPESQSQAIKVHDVAVSSAGQRLVVYSIMLILAPLTTLFATKKFLFESW